MGPEAYLVVREEGGLHEVSARSAAEACALVRASVGWGTYRAVPCGRGEGADGRSAPRADPRSS